MRRYLLILVLFLGAITGCVLPTRKAEPKNTYLLDISNTTASSCQWPATLQLRSCRAHAPLMDKALIYRLSPVRYERDYFNTFLVSPAEQIDTALQQRWLPQPATPATSRTGRQWVLRPTLEAFWADFSDPQRTQAQVQLHFLITELSSTEPQERVILNERVQATQALAAEPRAEDVVKGLSACLKKVIQGLEDKLQELPATETEVQADQSS